MKKLIIVACLLSASRAVTLHDIPVPMVNEDVDMGQTKRIVTMPTHKKLYRSSTDRVIAGVCGGLGEFFNIDPTLLRLMFVISAVCFGSGILLYILAWLIIPPAPH
jgi:phage shock protein PspC (stress-responsive transcriptional regulator)